MCWNATMFSKHLTNEQKLTSISSFSSRTSLWWPLVGEKSSKVFFFFRLLSLVRLVSDKESDIWESFTSLFKVPSLFFFRFAFTVDLCCESQSAWGNNFFNSSFTDSKVIVSPLGPWIVKSGKFLPVYKRQVIIQQTLQSPITQNIMRMVEKRTTIDIVVVIVEWTKSGFTRMKGCKMQYNKLFFSKKDAEPQSFIWKKKKKKEMLEDLLTFALTKG